MNIFPQTDILKTKSSNKLIYLNYYEPNMEFIQAKKNVFYYDESYKDKILISGPNAKDFLNRLFQKSLLFKKISFYDIVPLKFKNYFEVQVIRHEENKFFIIANDLSLLIKRFKKIKRQIKSVCLFDVSKAYKLYSIFNYDHAKIINFNNYKIIPTHYQSHLYHNVLVKRNDSNILTEFHNNNFLKVGLETMNSFLYNNNVLPYFNNLNRKTKHQIASILYETSFKGNLNLVRLEFLENSFHNNIIYSIKKRKVGKILNTYQLQDKSFPLAFALIKGDNADDYFFLKHERSYHLAKKLHII